MQKLFDEVGSLDKRCYEEFGLSEDILMEHAANGIADFIRLKFPKNSSVVVACGSQNNGADGLALARLLHPDYNVKIFYVKKPKSPMATLQIDRAHAIGVQSTFELNECDVLVDALYGSGFKGKFRNEAKSVIQTINKLSAYKIACDMPSGINIDGQCNEDTFVADITLTMGALKKCMFSDSAKEYVGEIRVLDLGVSRDIYETPSQWNLLDMEDLKLPFRNKKNTHKGSYGHLAVLSGKKSGASMMSGLAALKFGTGLVTIISDREPHNIPYSMMHSSDKPEKATALAIGMGLGKEYDIQKLATLLDNTLPVIADADIFSMEYIFDVLRRKNLVLTPHPKEFVSLLRITELADISIAELQDNRFKYSELFCAAYPNVTLLLKGANIIIGQHDTFFINSFGTSALAKGGSGDVLSGLIGALLAQGYSCLDSTINASLAHTKLTQNYKGADFSLTPSDLIEGIANL